MGVRGPQLLVVDPVTCHTQQPDLFGGVHPVDNGPPTRPVRESNDADLLHTVAGNAVRCGYLLVGASERVYTRTTGDQVARVPRYEEDAVHQLLRRRCLTLGGTHHHLRCGAATLTGTALLVPKQTRAAIARWEHRNRPPRTPSRSGGTDPTAATDPGTAAEPDAPTNGRRRSRDGGRALWCPECGEPAQPRPPARWTTANGPRPDHSHLDGEPLCPVVTATGYHPAWPTTRRPE